MSAIVESIRGEFARYRGLAEAAIAQLTDADLAANAGEASNSIATICWHVAGNLRSRFTDLLTTDGEKPWRKRDEEFERREVKRAELLAQLGAGWSVLENTLAGLTDDDLERTITVRQQPMPVHEALHRSLAHTAYHVGQIVFIAKARRGASWTYLSIPPGQSDTYNRNPGQEHGAAHAAKLSGSGRA
jgi:uncharacterized damage-inducible protein DinB